MLIADGQFLLFIQVPVQDRAQQLQIYGIFNVPVPHGNISAQYKVNNKYIEVTYDETQGVIIITEQQHLTCLHANGKFCKIDAPFQAVTNPPSCIAALYAKNNQEIGVQCSLSIFHTPAFTPITMTSNLGILISTPAMQGLAVPMICPDKVTSLPLFQEPFQILQLSPACSAMSRHFHLPPHYKDHMVMMHISLDRKSISLIQILTCGNILTATGLQFTCRNW